MRRARAKAALARGSSERSIKGQLVPVATQADQRTANGTLQLHRQPQQLRIRTSIRSRREDTSGRPAPSPQWIGTGATTWLW